MTLKTRVSKLEGCLCSGAARPDFIVIGSPRVGRLADGRVQVIPDADSVPGFAVVFSSFTTIEVTAKPNETMSEFTARLSEGVSP